MKIEFNGWKLLVWWVWVLAVSIFMIPTAAAIELYLFNRWLPYDWLWIPIYLILWRVWRGIEWIRKLYWEMPD